LDIKLKKSSKAGYILYCLLCIVLCVVISLVLSGASIITALEEMLWVQEITIEEDPYLYYRGQITSMGWFEELYQLIGWACILGIIMGGILLIAIMAMTGKYKLNEDGTYHLSWFDKIWSELHIAGCITAGVACLGPISYLHSLWMKGIFLGVWEWANPYGDSLYGSHMEIFIGIAGVFAASAVCLACFISLFKKLKAGEFWEKSLLGGSFFLIIRAIKNSNKTLTKVMVILIGGAVLSATWVGLIFVIALIIFIAPKLVEEFLEIKKGVTEVKNGNLTYKIPVFTDAKGIRGEFGRLAADINEISHASNLAIQNELKSQRLKTELISNVSHDLKTPLTSMVSYIDLVKKEGLDSPNAPEYLDIIDAKTQRLKVLTENLFEAAKASSGAIPVNMEDIDISSLLTQTLVEMEERLAQKNLEIQVKNDCEDVKVKADGQLTWRVLENLLGNVSKYAMDGSRVYINVSEHDVGENGMIRLEIKNISQESLNISADELMERFKRGDESRNTEGSGLGLAIAKDLTKMMNGVFEIMVDGDLFKATVMLERA